MKKKYWKYITKSFKHDLSRIITITSIVGLGVGFLVGLLSTTPDLFASMDNYYDRSNFSDVNIRSTVGFGKDTISTLKEEVSGIENVTLTYEEENYITINSEGKTNKVLGKFTYRDLGADNNSIDILTKEEGNWPSNENQCMMLVDNKATADYKVGDKIYYENHDGETKTVTIVGTVRDPNYITFQTEQSVITGGTIKSYLYFDIDNIEKENMLYTNAYVKFNETSKMDCFSKEYEQFVDSKISEIRAVSAGLINKQVEELKTLVTNEAMNVAKEELKQTIKDFIGSETVQGILPGLTLTDAQIDTLVQQVSETDAFKNTVQEEIDKLLKEQLEGMEPSWYILDRDAIKSAYVFKTDALKVQSIAMIFPPFFFLIALLVCLSSISRIITKDRQIIGTLKALGFSKGRICLKYILYGTLSSLIGCILGVGIGLFLIPWALMSVYSTLYYFQSMQFVFTAGYCIGFSLLMIGMITAVVLGVVFSNLKEPAATLMQGVKSPKPGRKILLERIPFIWKHLKFKYKSSFRNIFRFKKNLLMMIIGVGGCTGLLLTGFGIKDSFSLIGNDQYIDIIKYDAIVTSEKPGFDPGLIFDSDTDYMNVNYMHGTVYGEENINIEIFAGDERMNEYVGFYKTNNEPLNFGSHSVVITEQLADIYGYKVNQIFYVTTDLGTVKLPITGICRNYVSNFVYIGNKVFESEFKAPLNSNTTNAFLLSMNGLDDNVISERLNSYTSEEGIKAVIPTAEVAQTYDDIVSNLGMIVGLITILSGTLAAIVIYNLTDININERIREIATLRVCGYRRREVLMYILREILIMSLMGILVGLGIGVFLHWFIITNITSVGIFFSATIHWSSYLITIAIATAFVLGISFCFYPKIKKVSMTESLKSVD